MHYCYSCCLFHTIIITATSHFLFKLDSWSLIESVEIGKVINDTFIVIWACNRGSLYDTNVIKEWGEGNETIATECVLFQTLLDIIIFRLWKIINILKKLSQR